MRGVYAFNNYRKGGYRNNTDGVRSAIRVYICKKCAVWHLRKNPGSCEGCGHDEFIHFGSQPEAIRYAELVMLQNNGNISDLHLQPSFPISINGVKITTYRGDFAYKENGDQIYEDVKPKGFMTEMAKLKIKMASATYGVVIKIVERGS